MTLHAATAILLALLADPLPPDTSPVRFAPEVLGQDGRITLSPGFSPDGQFMVLAQSECGAIGDCPQRLKVSRRTAKGWSAPRTVRRTERARADWPSIAPDGRTVYLSWAADRPRHEGAGVAVDFDLYRFDLFDEASLPEPIDEPDISRLRGGKIARLRYVHNETAPVLTRSGDLYFWTERLEGPGERDIYVAAGDGEGGFEPPRALPAPINSAAREDSSWVTPDGDLMLLALTDRAGGEGDSDIHLSVKGPDGWSAPVPLGPGVNSPYADLAARITPDGRDLVFTSTRPFEGQGPGLLQVWTVPVSSVSALRGLVDGPL